MIKRLTEEVQTSLRSGVAITSLGQCAEELVFNSIDAKATCVAIRVDLETFKIQVVDNGSGMRREDLSNVGNRYFTSKCYSVEDLENLTCYGFRGEALASIASMASIVEIASKTNKTAKTFLKLFHNGKGLEVSEAELNRPTAGTTVTVYSLFHQLPVRRRCMDSILEFERVRHKVEAVSLMHPSVSFSLRNDASCSMVLQLSKTKDVCSRFSQIYGLSKSQKLRGIYHKSGGFEISGHISSEGHYNKNIQFLYVNNRLVLKTRIHKLIDFLLRKQSVICKTKSGPVTSSPVRHRSGPELYGVFVMNVKCQHDEYDVCLEPAKTLIEFRSWDALLLCIEEGVKAFLKQEHLFIELCGEDVKEFNEYNEFCLNSAMTLHPSLLEEKHMQENFKRACDNIVDSYEMFNLQSKSVRRKITLDKITSDLTGPTNNMETDLTITEPVHGKSSKVENSLPNKDSPTLDLPKLSNMHKEPNIYDDPQTEVLNSKSPQEGCGQDLSDALKTGSDSGTSLCFETPDKNTSSLHDPAFQESSSNSSTFGHVVNVRDVDLCKHQFLLKGALSRKCRMAEEGRGLATELNSHREATVGQESLKLCSTGLLVHLMQSQSPDKTADINHSSNMPHVLGPVSARDVFDKKLTFSRPTSNTQECLRMTEGGICTGKGYERMEIGHISSQKDEMDSLPAVGRSEGVRQYTKELISIAPSSSVCSVDNATSRKQMPEKLTRFGRCTFTKLSLHPKLGSLDRFRRHYGSIKNTQSITEKNRDEFAVPDKNKDHEHSSICDLPDKEQVSCNNNSCDCLFPLEKSQFSFEESKKTYVRESPLTLRDYSQSRTKDPRTSGFTGTLAAKVSKMKGRLKEAIHSERKGQLSGQSQLNLSPKTEDRCLSSQNNLLQNNCSVSQLFTRETGTKSYSFASHCPVQSNPMETSNARTIAMEDTASLSFIDTDGEYVISQKRKLALPNKEVCPEDTCEDICAMDGSSKQNVNTHEPMVVLSSISEGASDYANPAQNEESQCHPSEWFDQFDASLGRTVYINRMTGLSTYSAPPSEQPKAVCTQDISTMAVNVVMENDAQGESLQSVFSEWDNPVFARCPEVALNVSSEQADNLAVKIHNILYPYRFTKNMIESVQILNQVDNKFIACLINTRPDENKETDGNLLVLVDQHAAHERIRLEQLITDSYENQSEASGKKKLLVSTVCPPLEIEVTEEQRRLLWCYHKSLEDLGLELSFPENNPLQILVGKVPLCFVEREANELRRGRQTVAKSIVQEFIREEVELLQTTGGARGTLPLTILKVLASQACHGAIKFNDTLTFEECCQLMGSLSCCQLPFQCAHGRPSMLPLADIDHLQQDSQPKPNLVKLRKMAKAWQRFRKETDLTRKT
ncbi:DNA mismatch repair protein Mlh3 isoform X2 [Sphaerodactylus townsendi]|uniref:DNA mismatch repair protein Mlh3 isoform X2 n=1 Tax=Sphaerodactylus townsendi TaxID=933632 RepID=UPI002027204E|nr:DNA mismatch repair protein Mlh3 isoform X2 [Sphaerodactylus townsendi]